MNSHNRLPRTETSRQSSVLIFEDLLVQSAVQRVDIQDAKWSQVDSSWIYSRNIDLYLLLMFLASFVVLFVLMLNSSLGFRHWCLPNDSEVRLV